MVPPSRFASLAFSLALSACATAPAPPPVVAPKAPRGAVRDGTPDAVNIVKARAKGQKQLFRWADWSPETFARAKKEGRTILIHGAATWCHWCHVMEETTYRDPRVGALIRDKFVAIRVDIDSRPDIEERYGDWGWPATIVLDASAKEIAKYRGYLQPGDMLEALTSLEKRGLDARLARTPRASGAPVATLPWLGAAAAAQLDEYYDSREGGWGMRQKAPIGEAASFELRRAAHGDAAAAKRALFSLERQAALIDPVWGGIYQYSVGRSWKAPHYEKLMTYQARNLEAYADAYAYGKQPAMLAHGEAIARYMNTFLSDASGAYLVTQDADLSHAKDGSFVDGDVYFRLDDAGRRKLGIPRVDKSVYAEENGLAIAAMVRLAEASGKATHLARAKRAADRILRSHVDGEGRVVHAAKSKRKATYLADGAAFGHALARLAEASTGDDRTRYRDRAVAIADRLLKDFAAPSGALYGSTLDPDASGVFAKRRVPYYGNVIAARLLATLARLDGDDARKTQAKKVLAGMTTPTMIPARGRMIGHYLLALDEAGALRW